MTFTLKTFDQLTTRELHKIYQLRSAIFVVEQACVYQDIDDQDLTAHHLFLEEEGQLLAYCRLIPTTDLVKLGRVVVAQSARGQGLGRLLVEEALAACASHYPKKPIYAQAQAHLEAFYQSLDFVATSEVYLEDDIPHIDMIRKGSA